MVNDADRAGAKTFFDFRRRQYNYRVERLRVQRGMTMRAAKIVVDAAMYGKGCIEGEVRAKIEAQKEKPLD